MRILAIIPARGGSKGVPRKNLADVGGRPLIAWSIQTANELLELGAIHRCIVSTDDKEIAEVAVRYGGDVPFMRPADAATDTAKALAYITHALDMLEHNDEAYDAVMLLQPTSPIRDTHTFSVATKNFIKGESNSMISCYQEDYINELVMYDEHTDKTLRPRSELHNKGVRRQEHGPAMVRNGALYITRVPYLRKTGQLVCDRPMFLEMSKMDSIAVDAPDDLKLLQAVWGQ